MNRSPIKRKTRLRKVSAKRRAEQPARDRCIAIVRKRSGGLCELRCSPDCRRYGEHGHERLKVRNGGSRSDPANVLFACDPCNDWCESHHEEAVKRGFVIRGDGKFSGDSVPVQLRDAALKSTVCPALSGEAGIAGNETTGD